MHTEINRPRLWWTHHHRIRELDDESPRRSRFHERSSDRRSPEPGLMRPSRSNAGFQRGSEETMPPAPKLPRPGENETAAHSIAVIGELRPRLVPPFPLI